MREAIINEEKLTLLREASVCSSGTREAYQRRPPLTWRKRGSVDSHSTALEKSLNLGEKTCQWEESRKSYAYQKTLHYLWPFLYVSFDRNRRGRAGGVGKTMKAGWWRRQAGVGEALCGNLVQRHNMVMKSVLRVWSVWMPATTPATCLTTP